MKHMRPVVAFGALLAGACTTAPPTSAPVTVPAAVVPAAVRPLPAGDDWRSILPVAMGSTVAQIPFALKEVLLFRDESDSADAGEGECYSAAEPRLRLRGILAEDHVLCFLHDRLVRAEAVLRLPRDVSTDTFPRWCEEWVAGLADVTRAAEHCGGREGDTTFDAVLTYDTELAGPQLKVIVADWRLQESPVQQPEDRPRGRPPEPGP